MEVYRYDELDRAPRGSVVAIGFFDGVHLAHKALLAKARNKASDYSAPFGVFTFTSESGIKEGAKRLYDTETRLFQIGYFKPSFIVLVDFDDIRELLPEEFVRDVLIEKLGVKAVAVGENFRFGKGASGSADDLIRLMNEAGAEVIIEQMQERDGFTVSSSLIRRLIEEGNIKQANRLLVTGYRCHATVVRGNGEGRGLGFPTVNCKPNGLSPKRGVYYTGVKIDGETYYALTNVGTCPTLGEREPHLETHILGYCGDAYGKEIVIYFYDFIRDEIKFDSKEALVEQVKKDIETVRLAGEENDRAMNEVEKMINKIRRENQD